MLGPLLLRLNLPLHVYVDQLLLAGVELRHELTHEYLIIAAGEGV